MIKHRRLLTMFIVLTLLFFVALLVPYKYLPVDGHDDKLHHSIVFLTLTFLLFFSLRLRLIWTALIMTSLGAVSELSQSLVPNRSSSWSDLQANLIGVSISVLCIALGSYVYNKVKKPK